MKTSTLMICVLIFLSLASSNLYTQVASHRLPTKEYINNHVTHHDVIKSLYETEAWRNNNMTALQKHVSFFDRNHDGIIYPNETIQGLVALGFNINLSTAAAGLIHKALSQKTRPGKPPSLLLQIEIENIKLGKHGSDTDAYDNEGRFVESKFEEIFTKYAVTNKDALTEGELEAMLNGNKEPNDVAGSIAASSEWKMLYNLFKDKDGLLQKQTVRDSYDGTLFYQKEKNNKAK